MFKIATAAITTPIYRMAENYFRDYVCPECASILQELEDAREVAPPLSSVLEDLEEQARRGERFQARDSHIIDVARRMEQHEMRTGHSLGSFLRSKLPNWPYLGWWPVQRSKRHSWGPQTDNPFAHDGGFREADFRFVEGGQYRDRDPAWVLRASRSIEDWHRSLFYESAFLLNDCAA
jgi:hypothetical protein